MCMKFANIIILSAEKSNGKIIEFFTPPDIYFSTNFALRKRIKNFNSDTIFKKFLCFYRKIENLFDFFFCKTEKNDNFNAIRNINYFVNELESRDYLNVMK